MENEYNDLRKKYYAALVENFKKDIEIESLKKQLKPTLKYEKFDNILSGETMQILRSIPSTEAHDSKFILAAVRGFYADRLPDLKNKNVSGKHRSNQVKRPVTPEKKVMLKQLLDERTKNCDRSTERVSNLNKHIKNSIEAINKKQR